MEVNFEGNEQRALLGGNLNSSVPWAEDDRWWVRMPAQHTLYYLGIFRAMLYSIWNDKTLALLICVPFALLADPRTWGAKWTFAFNYMSLIALESRFISAAEWIWLFSSSTVSTILAEALPHVFHLMVNILYYPYITSPAEQRSDRDNLDCLRRDLSRPILHHRQSDYKSSYGIMTSLESQSHS